MGAEKLVNVVRSGLAWEVKGIRTERDLSLDVVCQQLRWQQSKLSRMENGQQHISDADLASLLVIYEVHGDERRRLLRLADRQDSPGAGPSTRLREALCGAWKGKPPRLSMPRMC